MALPARIVTFNPLALIKSSEFNSEFNNIIDLLSGASTSFSIRVRNSDNAFAVARFDQLGNNHILELFSNGAETFRFEKDGDFVSPFLSSVAGVFTFTSIPVGPGSNPTTDNQLARKLYIDGKKVSFIAGFPIPDPSIANTNARDFGSLVIPGGGTYTITKLKLMAREGSHTSGGDITFTFDRSGVGDIGGIDLDNTNNGIGVVYTNDIGNISPAENEIFSVRISARSGTISQRNVMAMIEGERTVF